MVERRAEVFARMSTLKEQASILNEIFVDKVNRMTNQLVIQSEFYQVRLLGQLGFVSVSF